MQDLVAKIRSYAEEKGLSQRALADKAGISQASVSRALSGKWKKFGGAQRKLFVLVGLDESAVGPARKRVLAAFDRTWDETEAHTEAIVRIIDAVGALRPRSTK